MNFTAIGLCPTKRVLGTCVQNVRVFLIGDYTCSNSMLADIKIIPPQILREDADL